MVPQFIHTKRMLVLKKAAVNINRLADFPEISSVRWI